VAQHHATPISTPSDRLLAEVINRVPSNWRPRAICGRPATNTLPRGIAWRESLRLIIFLPQEPLDISIGTSSTGVMPIPHFHLPTSLIFWSPLLDLRLAVCTRRNRPRVAVPTEKKAANPRIEVDLPPIFLCISVYGLGIWNGGRISTSCRTFEGQYRTDSRMQVLDAFETFKREGTHLHSELNVRVSSLLGGFPPVKERGPLPGVRTGWTVCIVTLC
jgi:hypothetical protein